MTSSTLQADHQVLKKALGIVMLLMIARLAFTMGDVPLFCTAPSVSNLLLTLLFDALTIVGIPLIVVTYQEAISRRARLSTVAVALVGFLLYELVRNSCAIPFLGR